MTRTTSLANKSNRRWLSFRLLDLLLLTTLVAAWLPYFLATRQFKMLEVENAALKRMAEILVVDDPAKLHVLKIRSNRYGAVAWKVWVPESANYELRFATQQISSLGFPEEFDRFPLPPGKHLISMIHKRPSRGHQFQLFVDQQLAIVHERPPEWIEYSSSQGTSKGGELEQFAVGEPVVLKREWFDEHVPGFPSSYDHSSDELSNKGNCVWIAPAKMVHPPLPVFVTPGQMNPSIRREWGFREGIRIRLSDHSLPSTKAARGMIHIVHTGTRLSKRWSLNPLVIKPRVDGQKNDTDSTIDPGSKPDGNPGLELTTSDSMSPPENSWQAAKGVFSDDGNTLRLFVHCERFSGGAQPIIEVRFDAQYPDRVGFRVHAGADSAEMNECVLSTIRGSFAQLRQLHLADEVKTTSQLFPQWSEETESSSTEFSPWKTFPGDLFPLVDDEPFRRVRLTTDVADYSKVKYSAAVVKDWQYKGLPARQSWLFPAETPVTVALRARSNYRDGNGPIPGGPALEDFELRMPLQPDRWIWYEVVPNPPDRAQ